jgi:hypothetical protein
MLRFRVMPLVPKDACLWLEAYTPCEYTLEVVRTLLARFPSPSDANILWRSSV